MEVGPRRRIRGAPLIAAVVLAILAAAVPGGSVGAGATAVAAPEGDEDGVSLQWEAAINGRPVAEIDANDPVRLDPAEGALIELTLTNTSAEELSIRSVRLDGKVMGLTMYNFTTRIDLLMPPDSVTTRTFDIDLIDLAGQANGLIPSRLQLLDDERGVVAEESFPADIRGSVNSVYGVFGFAVLGITLVLLGSLLLGIRRSQMPENRWKRAMRFLPFGIGLGFVLTFTLSATRQLAPSAASWTTVVLLCAAAAFAVGYFLPIGVPDDQESASGDVDSTGEEVQDDTEMLETVDADLATAGGAAGTARTGQSTGHYWTSGSQGQTGLDQPDAPEDDW
ncbi:hypothetical protein MWU75_13050 [Ornithinimicrobium sp. F0845]|uniref:hypothetical protein n=1 Tax=Ornithinimicrobium sp. F0845 TaxID=2926412 RepID=UPI001FF625AE|nr:hypothetical protein [Ornithinimicrobium sp. F0845]MCK0113071.1 hypothetical protein [Ornithinimicrobium sp. F0845]